MFGNNGVTEKGAKQLANAVRHWLNFQSLCGRATLFSESYLAQPVGEFLKGSQKAQIFPEWTIPDLRNKAPGRPRQVDYALLRPKTDRLVCAIEAKWINSAS